MSALPPKADMCGALVHVRFGPIADIGEMTSQNRKTASRRSLRNLTRLRLLLAFGLHYWSFTLANRSLALADATRKAKG